MRSITRLVAWDADGSGPQDEVLLVESVSGGGTSPWQLDAWDGETWRAASEVPGPRSSPLCVIGGDLICFRPNPLSIVRVQPDGIVRTIADSTIAGRASNAVTDGGVTYFYGSAYTGSPPQPVRSVFRYDGLGLSEVPADFRMDGLAVGSVLFAVWNGDLVAAGLFNTASGVAVDRVARWDGTAWHAFAPFPGPPSTALSPGVFQGSLFVTGAREPHRWTGNAWEVPARESYPASSQWPPAPQPAAVTYSSTGVYSHSMGVRFDGVAWVSYAGGFAVRPTSSADWRGTLVAVNPSQYDQPYARLLLVLEDGRFVPLLDGLSNPPTAITSWNSELVAVGIQAAGRRMATPVVRWDGVRWQNVGESTAGVILPGESTCVREHGGRLLLGRRATTTGSLAGGLYIFESDTWRREDPMFWSVVLAMAEWNGHLVALGDAADGRCLAWWDGATWQSIASGAEAASITSLASTNDKLLVLGTFSSLAGTPANKVAAWDGQQWSAFGDGPSFATWLGVYRGQPVVGSSWSCTWWTGSTWLDVPLNVSSSGATYFVEHSGDLVTGTSMRWRWSPELGVREFASDEENMNQSSARHAVALGDHVYFVGDYLLVGNERASYCVAWRDTPTCDCDSIDFNRDNLFPDIADIPDFLSVFQGGLCARQLPTAEEPCNWDIDFNNDGLFPDTLDIQAFLSVFSGGECVQ